MKEEVLKLENAEMGIKFGKMMEMKKQENQKQEDECPQIFPIVGCEIFSLCDVKKEDRTADWSKCPTARKEIKSIAEELKFEINKFFGIFHEDRSELEYLDADLEAYVEKLILANDEMFKKMIYKRR